MPIFVLKEIIQENTSRQIINILKASRSMPQLIKLCDKYAKLTKIYNDKIEKAIKLDELIYNKSTKEGEDWRINYDQLVEKLSDRDKKIFDFKWLPKCNVKYLVEEIKNTSPIFVFYQNSNSSERIG